MKQLRHKMIDTRIFCLSYFCLHHHLVAFYQLLRVLLHSLPITMAAMKNLRVLELSPTSIETSECPLVFFPFFSLSFAFLVCFAWPALYSLRTWFLL